MGWNPNQGENDYFNLCEKLVQDNCSATRKTALGLEAIQISRVTRVYNKLRRNTFDSKIDQLTNSDSQLPLDQSYCFIVCDPSKNSELVSIVENNKMDIVATSPLDADLRFHKNYNSSFPPSTTHLGEWIFDRSIVLRGRKLQLAIIIVQYCAEFTLADAFLCAVNWTKQNWTINKLIHFMKKHSMAENFESWTVNISSQNSS